MNRTFCTLIALAASVYIAPFQARAGGATQISGIGFLPRLAHVPT
jgi:hypothetical protein